MPAYLKMPKLSDTMTEGRIARWLIAEGDTVDYGTEIAEIETDKATMSWESSASGTVHRIYVPAGASAVLGSPLVLVLEEGEEAPPEADQPSASAPAPAAATKPQPAASPAKDATPPTKAPAPLVPDPAPAAKKLPSAAAPTSNGNRVKASPLARRLAAERGVDLARVKGTGPGGRIVREDLDFCHGSETRRRSNIGILPSFPSQGDQTIEWTGMRRVIAQRLVESKSTIPHFYLNVEIDAGPLMETRAQVNAVSVANKGPKFTVNDFVMRAVVLAAMEVPGVNASFQGDHVYQFGSVNLSVAVAIEGGLVTPVIRKAEEKSLADLSDELRELAARARDRKLNPDEMQGGTITISNLGGLGIHSFSAIINPPQACILAIGAVTRQPVVNDQNEIVPGQRLWITMSCDHRVIDGAVGATYLAALKKNLETPVLLIS